LYRSLDGFGITFLRFQIHFSSRRTEDLKQ